MITSFFTHIFFLCRDGIRREEVQSDRGEEKKESKDEKSQPPAANPHRILGREALRRCKRVVIVLMLFLLFFLGVFRYIALQSSNFRAREIEVLPSPRKASVCTRCPMAYCGAPILARKRRGRWPHSLQFPHSLAFACKSFPFALLVLLP